MTDITEFLMARIAEDEQRAHAAGHGCGYIHNHNAGWVEVEFPVTHNARPVYDMRFVERFSPDRVLAECEAKRRIIDEAFETASQIDGEWGCGHDSDQIRSGDVSSGCYGPEDSERFLKPLTRVYSDHPDFDPSWT